MAALGDPTEGPPKLGYWLFVIVFAAVVVWGIATAIHWLVTPADAHTRRGHRLELPDKPKQPPARHTDEEDAVLTD